MRRLRRGAAELPREWTSMDAQSEELKSTKAVSISKARPATGFALNVNYRIGGPGRERGDKNPRPLRGVYETSAGHAGRMSPKELDLGI